MGYKASVGGEVEERRRKGGGRGECKGHEENGCRQEQADTRIGGEQECKARQGTVSGVERKEKEQCWIYVRASFATIFTILGPPSSPAQFAGALKTLRLNDSNARVCRQIWQSLKPSLECKYWPLRYTCQASPQLELINLLSPTSCGW